MTWFSEHFVRTLAGRITPKIAPRIEEVVIATIRAELPGLLMAELRSEFPEHTPKRSTAERRMRDDAIRSMWNGKNASDLSGKFGISVKQVYRIATGKA